MKVEISQVVFLQWGPSLILFGLGVYKVVF